MKILQTTGWNDYRLLDTGNGKRLEQFGKYRLVRPDPQIIWEPKLPTSEWEKADAFFENVRGGEATLPSQDKKGMWRKKTSMPDLWEIHYQEITLIAKLSPFKHTGIFPEQSLQWDWMKDKIKASKEKAKILNLFAYTGGASLICAASGAEVVHVDASKPTIAWARENQQASRLEEKPIRWILDDAVSFMEREIRRGNTYEGIIMDPPVFGHGPHGERWEFFENFPQLLKLAEKLLSKNPLFVVVNAYAISASALMLQTIFGDIFQRRNGVIESGELVLEEKITHRLLSTGIFARWSA